MQVELGVVWMEIVLFFKAALIGLAIAAWQLAGLIGR